jgi:hypothetical protein
VSTRRPRLLPAALLASALVVTTAGGVLAATGRSHAPVDACSRGTEFVTVQPVFADYEWRPARPAAPTLAGCLDTSRIDKVDDPASTNPRG